MVIRKAYADIADGQMHYRHIPGEGTPLVFYHRSPSNSVCFEAMMQAMAGDRPLYAFDTPGFGNSFDPIGMPKAPQYGQWYLDALDALNLDQVHVFAHHTGTHFASEMAVLAPDRILSLTLNGIAYLTADEREQFRELVGHSQMPDSDGRYIEPSWTIVSSLFPAFDPKLTHLEFLSALRALEGRDQAHGAIWDQDYPSVFAKLTCPILALCAEDDSLMPFFDRVKQAKPEIKAVITGPAKYFSPEYDTDRTVSEVRAFLNELEAK